jgi:hypothetical protein
MISGAFIFPQSFSPQSKTFFTTEGTEVTEGKAFTAEYAECAEVYL